MPRSAGIRPSLNINNAARNLVDRHAGGSDVGDYCIHLRSVRRTGDLLLGTRLSRRRTFSNDFQRPGIFGAQQRTA